jgi:isopentenyl diphosphate isomerase/L-lactate dehydrogenase-like FMN-dependent dehydrogenase
VFDYIDGGAEDEVTLRANRVAFEEVRMAPRMTQNRTKPKLETKVLGQTIALPVLLAPCGLLNMVHPNGAVEAATAAAECGTVSVVSSLAGASIAEVAARAPGPRWFQVYAPHGRVETEQLLADAYNSGVDALVITVDSAVVGRRERDLRHGISLPFRVTPQLAARMALQLSARPAWTLRQARSLVMSGLSSSDKSQRLPQMPGSVFTAEDLVWIRSQWRGKLVVKGLMVADDARRVRDVGVDALIVSNHGGRQLDGAPSTLSALPPVVRAVADDIEVLMDGGVRRGRDVIAAIALGARAVLIGRPYVYGLAAGGREGVVDALKLLRSEMRRTMTLMGLGSVSEIRDRAMTSDNMTAGGIL